MKALAAEMVRNFGGRLEPLGIVVKELTGDMQLTKNEIMKTQVRDSFSPAHKNLSYKEQIFKHSSHFVHQPGTHFEDSVFCDK